LINAPRYGLLQASTLLKKDTEVGIFASKVLTDNGKFNFGFGFKKVLNQFSTLKAKVDKDLRTALWADYKLGGGFTAEGTVARDFHEENSKNGFLDTEYHVGLRLRYSG